MTWESLSRMWTVSLSELFATGRINLTKKLKIYTQNKKINEKIILIAVWTGSFKENNCVLCLNEWGTSKRGPVVIGKQIFVEPFSVRIGLCPAGQAQQRCRVY